MAAVPNQFVAPSHFTNVVLIVEGKKLHVSKEYLAIHSPVFAAMLFGEFLEKGKEEVEIKEVVYEEFLDLLNVIHPGFAPITATSVLYILKLADQFQIKDARDQSELFLLHSKKMKVETKLFLADQYGLLKLRDHCLKSLTCVFGLRVIKCSPDYSRLSDAMKVAICNRMFQLIHVNASNSHTNSNNCLCGVTPQCQPTFGTCSLRNH